MSQAQGGYAPQPTYPSQGYGQPQQGYPPAQAGYGQQYAQQYPGYQQPQMGAAPAAQPRGGGGGLKVMAILALVGFVLAGVGTLLIGIEAATLNNCQYNPGSCTTATLQTGINVSVDGIIITGVGFILAGLGVGLYFLMLPKRIEETCAPAVA